MLTMASEEIGLVTEEENSDDPTAEQFADDEDSDPQTLLLSELKNFAKGQAQRIERHIKNGANPNYLYDDESAKRKKLTSLHVLFDAYSRLDENDETQQQFCLECKTPFYLTSLQVDAVAKSVSPLLRSRSNTRSSPCRRDRA